MTELQLSSAAARGPLSRALIPTAAYATLGEELRGEIAAELNLVAVESMSGAGDLVEFSAKGNFRALGRRFGKQTPRVAAAIAATDAAALARSLADTGSAEVDVDGPTQVSADEVIITERPREGWSVLNEQGETIALDLHLTPELVRAGLAREVVRVVQETRKSSGLEVSDRIRLQWAADGDVAEALREHHGLVSSEVLAVELVEGVPADDWHHDESLGLRFSLVREPAGSV